MSKFKNFVKINWRLDFSVKKEQITNYEKKTRDLVRAYKGLVKEKEALEKSLAILNTKTSEEITENDEDKEGDYKNFFKKI